MKTSPSRFRTVLLLAFAAIAGGVGTVPAHAQTQVIYGNNGFRIDLVPGATLASNAAALAAFDRSAQAWANNFYDNITITINADVNNSFGNSSNIIGSTSARILNTTYDTTVNLMKSKFASDQAISLLPTSAQFNATVPTNFVLDNTRLLATKANLKAIGYSGLDTTFGASDATITFNSNFAFDYDSSNGVSAGTEDFQTVATHEIGHALGFISVVDDIDYYQQFGYGRSNAPVSATNQALVSAYTLDLYRFSTASLPTAATYSTAARDFLPTNQVNGVANNNAIIEATYDLVNTYGMATGAYNGDGSQASHWKDDAKTGTLIGIMDPTLSYGVQESISSADLRAFHLMGYNQLSDVSPEPPAASLALFAAVPFALRAAWGRRRRK